MNFFLPHSQCWAPKIIAKPNEQKIKQKANEMVKECAKKNTHRKVK